MSCGGIKTGMELQAAVGSYWDRTQTANAKGSGKIHPEPGEQPYHVPICKAFAGPILPYKIRVFDKARHDPAKTLT